MSALPPCGLYALTPERSPGVQDLVRTVTLAIDAGALLLLPADEGQAGSWEVGAMLVNEGRDRSWEMLRNRATEIV